MLKLKRDNEAKDNGHNMRAVPLRLHDARLGDVAPRMDELFPEFRFYFSSCNGEMIYVTAYRKGIIFPFGITMDEAYSFWRYESIVPVAKRLMERWNQYRNNLMAIMHDVGEPKGIIGLMDGMTMDNEEGYLVTGLREDKSIAPEEMKNDIGSV